MNIPETWHDEEAIEADMKLWLQSDLIEHSENVRQAFRIGWKAGARKAAMDIWKTIRGSFLAKRFQEGETDD